MNQPKLAIGINRLVEAARVPSRRICLMCGCMQPNRCHRSRLVGKALLGLGIDLQPIMGNDQIALPSQLPLDLTRSPGALFDFEEPSKRERLGLVEHVLDPHR